jgi:hypothetical protein
MHGGVERDGVLFLIKDKKAKETEKEGTTRLRKIKEK